MNVSLHCRRNGRSLRNRYGPGSGPIWLDNLHCTGTESQLGSCRHNGWGNNNCGHSEDVSIQCLNDSIPIECAGDSYRCNNSNFCIRASTWCDGNPDCSDNSDEPAGCRSMCPSTAVGARFCGPSSTCLFAHKICDRHQDCADDSDEVNCTCRSHQYQCTNGRCIYRDWLCDGVEDCPGGDDELPSLCNSCDQSTQFRCSRGRSCISANQQCDGYAHCTDTSDEAECLSMTSTSVLSVKYRGVSGYYVCADQWTSAFSDAVCRQLGDASASSTSNVDASSLNQRSLSLSTGNTPSANILQQLRPATCRSRRAVSLTCAPKVCGLRSPNIGNVGPYIIDGQWAERGAWPWQIMLKKNGGFACGGSLINNRWVLTAAHCIYDSNTNQAVPASQLRVRLGGILATDPDPDVVYADVSRVIKYPYYTKRPITGDVGLLQLSSAVTYTDTIRPICLPPRDVNLNQFKVCVDTGFGRTNYSAPAADRLLQAKMNIIPHSTCSQNYNVREFDHICIGSQPPGDQSICFGDSGGPFACKDQQNTWTVIGVNSLVFGSCKQSVVARVPSFVDWIHRTIANNP